MKKDFVLFFFACCIGYASPLEHRVPESNNLPVFKTLSVKQFVSDCVPDIYLSSVENNTTYLYQAANSIRVSDGYRILGNSDSDIAMKAGEVIVLKPNSVVLKGNHYLARIEPCDMPCAQLTNDVIQKGISPNGDNKNEFFDLSAYCIRNIKIFNRYGILVYEAKDYTNEWHGQSDKGNLPSGTYYYIITPYDGTQITGWVYIQREIK